MKNLKRGFTLIELLVVIAIIGILASVVLSSVNSAREKGQNAKVKASISAVVSQSAIYLDTSATGYDGVCTTDSKVAELFSSATTTGGVDQGEGTCNDDVAGWAIAVSLRQGGVWCVDSENVKRSVNSADVAYTATYAGADTIDPIDETTLALDDTSDLTCN